MAVATFRRVLMVLGMGFVLNTTGCALLKVLMLPFELLFGLLGLIGDGVGALHGAVTVVEPLEGPAPVVRRVDDGRFAVGRIAEGARFDVVCSAPGRSTRRYRWPDDFAALRPDADGRIEVRCLLEPLEADVVSASGRDGG